MGFLKELVDFFDGSDDASGGRVDRLCRDLGWSVDDRDGNMTLLSFNSPDGGTRNVIVIEGEFLISFSTMSFGSIEMQGVPTSILTYLLSRNYDTSCLGNWAMSVGDSGETTFHLAYHALGDGVDAYAFRRICESLCAEALDFDRKLPQSDLLR